MFRILFKYYFYCRYCVVLCCVGFSVLFGLEGQHGAFMAVLLEEGCVRACVLRWMTIELM